MRRRPAAAPYAKALFAIAKERNQTELVGRELDAVAATLESDLALRDFLARPWIPTTAKRAVAMEVAERSGFSTLTSNFLALVAERGRADHLEAIAEKYQQFLDEDLERVRAHVRTVVPLSDEERGQLSTKLGQALGPAGGAHGSRRPRDAGRLCRGEWQHRVGWEPRGATRADAPSPGQWLDRRADSDPARFVAQAG
jgi:ATP synthase F1 delta subunit